jgi:hypothetical protein
MDVLDEEFADLTKRNLLESCTVVKLKKFATEKKLIGEEKMLKKDLISRIKEYFEDNFRII